MRALYLSLCLIAVAASPPRHFKRLSERKLDATTESKIEDATSKQIEERRDLEAALPSPRGYYENQNVNLVSSTVKTYTEEKQYPEVNIAPVVRPQVTVGGSPQPAMQNWKDSNEKNVYTVNVYVNFPPEKTNDEYSEEDECERSGKCFARMKCKEGQVSVKGVCTDRH